MKCNGRLIEREAATLASLILQETDRQSWNNNQVERMPLPADLSDLMF